MSTDRDTTRIVRSWLEEGATALPDRILDAVLDQVPSTSQRRPLWTARRFNEMNNALKLAIAAAAVVVVAIIGVNLLPRNGGIGGTGPSPSPVATPATTPTPAPTQVPPSPTPAASGLSTGFPEAPLKAGTYTLVPFTEGECHDPPQPGCTETHRGDSLGVTVTIPAGWFGAGQWIVLDSDMGNGSPGGAGVAFERGAWLLTDPCVEKETGNWTPVGPTVADFVDAVAKHPILDTTKPIDVKLDGYSGKYFDLQVPADISTDAKYNPECPYYRPWEPGIYAQGASQRWHVWVVDVDGTRVVVQTSDFAATSAAHRAELRAIVDSITFQP
jgi:hypothetical protein